MLSPVTCSTQCSSKSSSVVVCCDTQSVPLLSPSLSSQRQLLWICHIPFFLSFGSSRSLLTLSFRFPLFIRTTISAHSCGAVTVILLYNDDKMTFGVSLDKCSHDKGRKENCRESAQSTSGHYSGGRRRHKDHHNNPTLSSPGTKMAGLAWPLDR